MPDYLVHRRGFGTHTVPQAGRWPGSPPRREDRRLPRAPGPVDDGYQGALVLAGVAKTLVIAEKPSVARDLSNALPGSYK